MKRVGGMVKMARAGSGLTGSILTGRGGILMLLLGGLMLVIICIASVWLGDRTAQYTDALQRAYTLRVGTGRLTNALTDAETGQRGYLLARDPAYLAPYNSAIAALPKIIKDLQATASREVDKADIAQLSSVVDQKLAELAETIRLQDAGQPDKALDLIRTDLGKDLMEQARVIAVRLVASADEDVAIRVREMHRNTLGVQVAAIAGSLMVVILFGGFAWTIARYNRELRRASVAVEELNRGLEDRVEQRTADLKQANDEIQRFAYIVSHDLRAPLVNIMGFTAELDTGLKVLRDFADTVSTRLPEVVTPEVHHTAMEDVPEALGFIRASTTKMDRLINAILKLSREGRRALTVERVDMAALLNNILGSLRHQIIDASADVRLEGQIPTLISDRVILEQVFSNLIDNAIKYLDPQRPGKITVSGRIDVGYAMFLVADNGRGIDPKDYERVFELFRRSGVQDRPGEGIGLAHVRTLVRRLGGDITVSSILGQGSTFTVRLPRITKVQVETEK